MHLGEVYRYVQSELSIGKIKAFIFMFLMDVEDYTEKIVAAQTKI